MSSMFREEPLGAPAGSRVKPRPAVRSHAKGSGVASFSCSSPLPPLLLSPSFQPSEAPRSSCSAPCDL
ncbi:hypothetical protein EYF80_064261 [Liparis tanakae]|uniref:Uncharacterized protein n=1 Tax=Liparis tanakae TaxID=230148 RepID=A0A4Z2E9W8_9TELE|nr:hypothetical protein EYF80_064261 [Liparis tanakae]